MTDDLSATVQALQDILREPSRAAEIATETLAEIMRRRMGIVACPEGRVAVRIPALRDGETGWAKWVIAADPKERGGFMFEGPFLPLGRASPLPPGAVVLIATGAGGMKRHVNQATAYIVQENGELAGDPLSEPRGGWPDLAQSIVDYLKTRRDLPLISERRLIRQPLPPAVPPLPVAPAPPATVAASADPPGPPPRKARGSRRRSAGSG